MNHKESQRLRRVREWTEADQQLLERVNRTRLTGQEIAEFIEAVQSLPKKKRFYEARVIIASDLHPGDHEKAFALMFRTDALARFLDEEGVPAWTLRVGHNRFLMDRVVFDTAAIEPLIEKDSELTFNREAFLQKALELAEVHQIG
jgi:hypothetical protein